ncbi:ATP-binding protein [Phenylobacterium sp.]|uniref:hybrid sensor histidine kinase/response regulator n=1 Tax=Phenylobacterium sp. TaxID=1871053 RepID=UPI0027180469|nr:ATP-binding protein [Phenylobacterium sp.]MDO8800546.1 ATP-binding protein [Phenylobacterium sp.]
MAERDSERPGATGQALAARLNNLPATWKLTLAFAAVLSAIAAMGAVLAVNLGVVQRADADDNHAHRVAATASSARFTLTRQEASLRGYIISGDPFYARRIADYHRPLFQASMAELERLAAGDPLLLGQLDQAQSAYDIWNEWAVVRALELAGARDTRSLAAEMVGPASPADDLIAPAEQALEFIQAQSQRAVKASGARKAEAMRAMGSALAFGVLFAALSAAVMGLALRRSMANPIVRLTAVMNRLARGDHSVSIPASDRRDEVGLMAKAVVTFRDAAIEKDLLEAEAEVRREEAQALALQAQAANHAKSEFLATMAHELRTPLNGVLGLVDVMSRTDLNPSQREHLATIGASGRALVSVVNDVLDISRIEAGSLEILPEPFDMDRLTSDLDAIYGAMAADKGLAFTLTVSPGVRGWRLGDPARLRQIAGNLISNGLKFTDAGEVRVAFSRRDDQVVLEVIDTGIGVAAHQQAAMFDRFVQADGSSTRRFGGAGLGLAICKELSELMGGTIGFTSELGVGSTFTLQVPLPACPAPAEPGAVAPMDDMLRILVVDDNATNRLVLCALLEQLGLVAECVINGVEAVAAWESRAWDAILMDIHMPEMDGVTATSSIRQREAELGRDKTPIIAVTASVQPEETRGYLSAGMDDCVPKPVDTRVLVNALQGVFAA